MKNLIAPIVLLALGMSAILYGQLDGRWVKDWKAEDILLSKIWTWGGVGISLAGLTWLLCVLLKSR